MEIHAEELKVIDLFRKNILCTFTLKKIMKKLNKKSYNWTYKATEKLSKGILISERVGRTTVIKLNIMSNKTLMHLLYLDKKEAYAKNVPLVDEIIASCSKLTPFFTLLVTGSYATGTPRKTSDIDIVIITEDNNTKTGIKPYIREATKLSGIAVDDQVFTKEEFYRMLVSDNENFGKEVFRKHLLFYGNEAYYQIVREAIQNGLPNKI